MKYSAKTSICLTLLFLFVINALYAQQEGRINGTVVDSIDRTPIDFANVTLLNATTKQAVKGGQTNEQGEFSFSAIPEGDYILRVSFVGFNSYEKPTFHLDENAALNVGFIPLSTSASTRLKEVVIEGAAPAMEIGIDRRTFNVEQSIVSEGGTATELLANVPSLSVDMDGNVGLRGSTNVRILIDGKPSALAGSNINVLLESLPANSVERVEVMTNPSSKYDPEGQGGIINIILKKNVRTGFNGMARFGGGRYYNLNGGLDLNYRDSKFNYFGSYNYRRRNSPGDGFNDSFFPNGERVFNTSDNARTGNSHTVRAGVDYFLDEKTTIGFSSNINVRDNVRREDLFYSYFSNVQSLTGTSERYTRQDEDDFGYDLNLDFKRDFSREGEQLQANIAYGRSKEDGLQTFDQTASNPSIPIDQNRINDTYEDGNTTNIQVDYTLPFNDKQKLEAGYRSLLRFGDEQQLSDTLNTGTGQYLPDYNISNIFKLEDIVHALYVNYQSKLTETFGYQVGLRAEQAYLNTEYISVDPSIPLDERTAIGRLDYFRVYPSIYLTKELDQDQSLQLSYTRRVNRPRGWQVNPFIDVSDPMNLRQGNPNLMPEDIHSFELGYSKQWDKVNFTSSIYHRLTNDVVELIVDSANTETNATFSQFQNLSRNQATGIEIISQITLGSGIDLMANFNGNYLSFRGSEAYNIPNNSGFNWDANLTGNVRIAKNFTGQLRADYMAPRVMAQGRSIAMFMLDAGLKLNVLQDRGSFLFNVRDILNQRRFGGTQSTPYLERSFQRRWMRGPVPMLTFSYRFGKRILHQDENGRGNEEDYQDGEVQVP